MDVFLETENNGTEDNVSNVSILGGVFVFCIYRRSGGVIVGDLGLCCCGPALNVSVSDGQYYCSSADYFPLFVDRTSHCILRYYIVSLIELRRIDSMGVVESVVVACSV